MHARVCVCVDAMPPTSPPELLIAVGGICEEKRTTTHHPLIAAPPYPRIRARESAFHLALFGRFKVTFDMVFLVSGPIGSYSSVTTSDITFDNRICAQMRYRLFFLLNFFNELLKNKDIILYK